ncbi:hypothetical protein [Orenia marismortui]|uniref:Uncharacterized protein n=1 Tax=Orenia marismortui TaxID=46469 RepID=A0A4R8HA29_9FIRM|nr:hypothetical protein [Orenia marismortui]TDX52158.1 hypothetical protein C7959_10880 [Orenia marismortui]
MRDKTIRVAMPLDANLKDQPEKIKEEFKELIDAIDNESCERQGLEACDLIQTCRNFIELLGLDYNELVDKHREKMIQKKREWYQEYIVSEYRLLKNKYGRSISVRQFLDETDIKPQLIYELFDGIGDIRMLARGGK